MPTKKSAPDSHLLSALISYLRPQSYRIVIGMISLIFNSLCMISIPHFVRLTIDGIGEGISSSDLLLKCGIIIALASISGVLLYTARWLIIGSSREIEMQMRNDFFGHIQQLSLGYYHRTKTGDLVTRFSSDIDQVRMLIGPGIMYPTITFLVTVLAFYAMLNLNVQLTLTLLIPILALIAFVNLNTRKLHRVFQQAQEIYSELSAKVQENFSGIRVIKAYCQEQAEIDRFDSINSRYVEKNIEQIKLRGRLFPFMKLIGGIGTVLVLWVGGMKVIQGEITLGVLVQFAIYYQMLMWPMIALGWIINVIHRGLASWRRLQGVFQAQPDVIVEPERETLPIQQGIIEIRNLTFAYNETTEPVLKDISLQVKSGQTLAIVGPTGCGKTTIVNVLMHLYPVPRDTVFLDGYDINDIPLDQLRNAVGYVSQEVFLFSDSIRNNLAFGVPDYETVTDDQIHHYATRAELHKDVQAFPHQYDTEIGERGITLSGGQKQRLGIARALILNRPIMILDDSLSAVDTNTEESILKSLKDAIDQTTTILISHRISTVKNADHIIVLDDGQIIEEGLHEDLIETNGLYARIYQRQLLEESLGIRS
jgi:ATP-binding cassette subfamily B multidrug efflux pump